MLVLTETAALGISSTAGAFSSDYSEAALFDDYPSHPFVSSARSDTLTVTFDAGQDSMFIGHCVAEEVEVTFDTGENYQFLERIGWNRVYARGRKKLAPDIYLDVPPTAVSATIQLRNIINIAEGIDKFNSNGTNGFISRGNGFSIPVLFKEYPQLRLGTNLEDPGGNNHQILELIGTGEDSADVILSGGSGASSFDIDKVYLPISVGVIRVGKSEKFPNPQVGLVMSVTDYGVRQESFGSMTYASKDISRNFSVPMQLGKNDLDRFMYTWEGLRGNPVATDLLEGLDPRGIGWMSMDKLPEITANIRRYNLFEANFQIREVH
jgi:hypothetical protein